jgi:hypothetical protein
MASASLCGLTNVAADKRSDDCATLRAALLLTRLQLNLGVRRTPGMTVTSELLQAKWVEIHKAALLLLAARTLPPQGGTRLAAENVAEIRAEWARGARPPRQ